MIWGPFLLALALGLVVSAGLYFAYLWPQVEPDDEAIDAASVAGAKPADPVTDDEPAREGAKAETDVPPPAAEAGTETEAKAPSTESSPA